jgi:regulator of protease activity HflC (stomatin/prohibitin superfamily)
MADSLNKKIARLLGKRGHNMKPPKATSRRMFWFIMLIVALFLWGSTGIYYLSEDMYGIVLYRGQFNRVVKGLHVGLTLPLPFAGVIAVDARQSYLQYLGDDGSHHTDYNMLLHDSQMIGIKAQFAYQITDPRIFYIGYLANKHKRFNVEERDLLRAEIVSTIKNSINKYLATDSYPEAIRKNLTIMGSDIENQVNQVLAKYGISVIKLNIISLNLVDSSTISKPITPHANSNNLNTVVKNGTTGSSTSGIIKSGPAINSTIYRGSRSRELNREPERLRK